jgi:hypothetical protein
VDGTEVLAKDYIASFKCVRDLEPLGIEGRRAHTMLPSASARLGLRAPISPGPITHGPQASTGERCAGRGAK